MNVKSKNISALIESQLPGFIVEDYEYFVKFLKSYYAQQELSGGVLDIVSNLTKYRDINFYDKEVLTESSKTVGITGISDTSINVLSTSGFPDSGLAKVDDEIFFYASKTSNQFNGVARGVSGNTELGDLYKLSTYVATSASTHAADVKVENISNLFLYALVQSFESEYLAGIPEKYLRGEIDKRTLIKNISSFYKSKGTKRSIQFIFNSLISSEDSDVYFPKDNTLKASDSDYINVHALKVIVTSGDPKDLIGKVITETGDNYASAVVDNIKELEGNIWELVLAPSTINNQFTIASKTTLKKAIGSGDQTGSVIDVDSTFGWAKEGNIFADGEVIQYASKTIRQFKIKYRSLTRTHNVGQSIYSDNRIKGNNVEVIALGIVYNLSPTTTTPYGIEGEPLVVEESGFDTIDPKIKKSDGTVRWLPNDAATYTPSSGDTRTQTSVNDVVPGIQRIFSDDNNYYICTSGVPVNRTMFYNQTIPASKTVVEQSFLRTIRKNAITTTEVYKTPRKDFGILVDGSLAYTHKHQDSVFYGGLTKIAVTTQGGGYSRPPYVLVNTEPYKATAILSGTVVESVRVDVAGAYTAAPTIEIVSGRNAVLTPVITRGAITSLLVTDPGEYYSAPPTIRIVDALGRGRFAEYTATVSATGQISGCIKVSGGSFYSEGNVVIQVIPSGSGALASSSIYEWIKNRLEVETDIDTEWGFSHLNDRGYQNYGTISYPPTLRGSDTGTNHSPIIGFAYDGNPIYGPYGYSDPVDSSTSIVRMQSGYKKYGTRPTGPSLVTYPLGTFIQDYYYADRYGTVDKNNGRYCVTPEYPNGTYAYFATFDSVGDPEFPYLIGENFYSLPLAANYDQNQTQNDLPLDAVRLRGVDTPNNGRKTRGIIKDVSAGSLDAFQVYGSSNNFKVGSSIVLDNTGTNGIDATGTISAVKGNTVEELQATDAKRVAKLQITENCYVFSGDVITQSSSGISGKVVGDVLDGKILVLEDVTGTFDQTGLFDSTTLSINIILNTNATFTAGATIELTNGTVNQTNPPSVIATGEVIETTEKRNSVKIKVISGTFSQQSGYFLRSNNLLNTVGAEILSSKSLSTGLIPFIVNTNIALVETTGDHALGVGDVVYVEIDPDDSISTTTYYVQLGATQEVDIKPLSLSTKINDPGLGRADLVNGGADYASNTYTDVELIFADQNAVRTDLGKVADSKNAKATIVVSDIDSTGLGSVTNVTITTKGSGYQKGDVLTVEDTSLNRSGASTNTQRLRLVVDHIGLSTGETVIKLDSIDGLSNNDLLSIGDEIVKVNSISESTTSVTVTRAQNNTSDIDHFDNEVVALYGSNYRFTVGDQLPVTGTALDPVILSYDGNKLIVEHNQGFFTSGDFAPYKITDQSTIFDESEPKKLIDVDVVTDYKIVTKISSSSSGPYQISPNLKIQEYYQYRFDLSHYTNGESEFIVSPSQNDNIIAPEVVNIGTPGTTGAYSYVKFGYGPRLGDVQLDGILTKRVPRSYQRYYYKSIVRTMINGDKEIRIGPSTSIVDNNNYFELINDPLQGQKLISDALTTSTESTGTGVKISFVTSDRFVYELTEDPEWYGTGNIRYTTKSKGATGAIAEVEVSNLGSGYRKVPGVLGAELDSTKSADITAQWDSVEHNIVGVTINKAGFNYSKPKVVVVDGDGSEAKFDILKTADNRIANVIVTNKGKNYTYKPSLKVVEGDIRIFALGSSIGAPKNVELEFNGSGIWNDTSLLRKHKASDVIIVDTTESFLSGEKVTSGLAEGTVTNGGWRIGSNILKVSVTKGEFVVGQTIKGSASNSTGTIVSVQKAEFAIDLKSYYDNLGTFVSDKGKVGVRTHKVADNKFYQDYSYVVESKTQIEDWRDLIKDSVHPAGFKMFGELNIDAKVDVKISTNSKTAQVSTLRLWDENSNNASIIDTKRYHQTVVNLSKDINVLRGNGSFAEKSSDTSGLIAREVKLTPHFDGVFDQYGNISGTREFTIVDAATNNPLTPYNAMALTITLDAVLQEPETAYTISGDKITFAKAPFGIRQEGNNTIEATKFIGRLFQFKEASKNLQYLKKVRPIFQKEGTWIDAANQLRFNRTFIQEEAIGYVKDKYPSLTWNTLESKCMRDIGLIVDAYEHDLRFGGNSATYDAAEKYFNDGSLAYIDAQKDESIEAYKYTMNLCIAAARNWDISVNNCTVSQGQDIITLPSTLGVCVGMNVSSGNQFDEGTTVTEIVSSTQIKVSKAANIAYPAQSISTTVNNSGTTNYGPVTVTGTGVLNVGIGATTTVYSTINQIDQITFSFSRINSGKFMDAANLIEGNKKYISEETIGWLKATYPNLAIPNEDKCQRDTEYLIDAMVYHIRYGGNWNVVDFGERYYYKNKLNHIVDQKAESIAAYTKATQLMVEAMKNNLPTGTYTTIVPYEDTTILADPNGPYTSTCAEVESALNSYIQIVTKTIDKGPNLFTKVEDNNQRTGNWTTTRTLTNINILAKGDVFSECDTVVSALNSLFLNVESILNSNAVVKSLPDFFNGKNTDFELYYTDNTPVKTEVGHDLIVGINGVFQNAKYDADYPRLNSYYIKRSSGASNPDRIVFSEPPKWEQNLNTLTVQEPLAVEKFFAHNVGGCIRMSLDEENFNGSITGPFIMRDEKTGDVVVIDDDRFAFVYVDGILQKRNAAYTINESSITFSQALKAGQRVSILLLTGTAIDQLLDAFNVEPDRFFNEVTITVTGGSAEYATFISGVRDGTVIYQFTDNSYPTPDVYTTIGMVRKYNQTASGWDVTLIAQNPKIDLSKPLRLAATTDLQTASYTEVDLSALTTAVTYNDVDGKRLLRKDSVSWLYDRVKPTITSLEPGDSIKIDGETDYRTVKLTHRESASLGHVEDTQVSDNVGVVSVSNYNGSTKGEGLNITAVLTGDVVTSLNWNKTTLGSNPQAHNYDTPPVLTFEPANLNGGGAKAHAIVDGGNVIDVILTDGGSGYTAAPIVNVSRGYDIIKKTRQFDTKYIRKFEDTITGLSALNTTSFVGEATQLAFEFTHSVAATSSQSEQLKVTQQLVRENKVSVGATEIHVTTPHSITQSAMGTTTSLTHSIKQIEIDNTLSMTGAVRLTTPTNAPTIGMGTSTSAVLSATLLDTDFDWTDSNVMVSTTDAFDATGVIQVGKFRIAYSSKLSDRFIVDYGSADSIQPSGLTTETAGTVVRQV